MRNYKPIYQKLDLLVGPVGSIERAVRFQPGGPFLIQLLSPTMLNRCEKARQEGRFLGPLRAIVRNQPGPGGAEESRNGSARPWYIDAISDV